MQERIRFYDERVRECVDRLRDEFDVEALADATWRDAKLYYIGLLVEHSQPELAETFFNSVIKRILHRSYYDNELIFVRAGDLDRVHRVRPADLPQLLPERRRAAGVLRAPVRATSAGAGRSPTSTATSTACCARSRSGRAAPWTHLEPNHQIQVLELGASTATRRRTCSARSSTATTSCRSSSPSSTTRDGAARAGHDPARPAADQHALLALARLLPRRHGGAVRHRRVPALDGAAARRAPSSTRSSGSASRARRSSSASCCSTSTTPATRSSRRPGSAAR